MLLHFCGGVMVSWFIVYEMHLDYFVYVNFFVLMLSTCVICVAGSYNFTYFNALPAVLELGVLLIIFVLKLVPY